VNRVSKSPKTLALLAVCAVPLAASLPAQAQDQDEGLVTTVSDTTPDQATMTEGPQIDGIISARKGNRLQVTSADGTRSIVTFDESTRIKSSGGFLGLNRNSLGAESLLTGLPVSIETKQWDGNLVASQIDLKNKDLKTAAMIHNGTNQRFEEQAAATEALRSRMGDIDKYNIKDTTNVYFDTGRYALSPEAKQELCAAASQAESMDNALLLVVGYTDSTGGQELNQRLSEKRAGGVVNYLQQACHWKPWRMLTPTGMAEADPLADNTTAYGKAQNRRVAVNILVSKAVDGF